MPAAQQQNQPTNEDMPVRIKVVYGGYVVRRTKRNIGSGHSSVKYSGTSVLMSPTGLGKSDLNGEVTLLQGVISTVEYNLGLSQGDCNREVFLLVR